MLVDGCRLLRVVGWCVSSVVVLVFVMCHVGFWFIVCCLFVVCVVCYLLLVCWLCFGGCFVWLLLLVVVCWLLSVDCCVSCVVFGCVLCIV